MIKNEKNILLIVGIICLMISTICLVSYSTQEINEVIVKNFTPIYDEESTVSVYNLNVTFNDKNQVVKYSVLVENTRDYDVKVSELQFGTQSEEFLIYTVENVELDDVIKAGESKELVISFETVKMDGWGRNFNDEIVTTLVFDKIKKSEEVVTPPVVDTNKNENNNSVNNVLPETNVPTNQNPSIEEPKEDVNNDVVTTPEEDANHELGMEQEIIVKDSNTGDVFVIFCFGAAVGVLGIGLVMVNKNKFTKYVVVFILVGATIKIGYADEVIDLSIPINVSYESQNVMMAFVDEEGEPIEGLLDVFSWIRNYYIENETREITNYIDAVDISHEQNGRVVAYFVENVENSNYMDVYIQADGIIYPNENMSYYFAIENLNMISNLEGFDTSNVTNMSYMFKNVGIYYSSEALELDLSDLDTSSVTNMQGMFSGFGYSRCSITLDISGFDTSNVTNMSYMFEGIGSACTKLSLDLDLSNLDTSNVTDMSWMFNMFGFESTTLTLDVSNFDTSKVTDMSGMFSDTGYNSESVTIDLSSFDTSNVTNMSSMFYCTGYNSESVTIDLSSFDTSNVTDMSYMFSAVGGNNKTFTLDVSDFDTSNVTNMSSMFSSVGYNSTNVTLDLSNFDTSNVTNMSSMFSGVGYNSETVTIDVSGFDTSNVTDMSVMFNKTGYNATTVILDVSCFDTSKVTNMEHMFSYTGYNSSVFTLDVSNFETSNVTNMGYMFYNTGYSSESFTLDVSNFDTSNVDNTHCMFYKTGYNSAMLNISITIKNPNNNDYGLMFRDVATKGTSQITVNYTGETEALVEQMLSTKSSASNVAKGWNVDVPITFTIDGVTYNAYEGMTWGQWIDSEFNNGEFINGSGYIFGQASYVSYNEYDGYIHDYDYIDVDIKYTLIPINGDYSD